MRPARLALAVQGRYKELNGRELALAITLSAFLSTLLPMAVGMMVAARVTSVRVTALVV